MAAGGPVSVWSMLQTPTRTLSTGCPQLDHQLQGGFPCGGLIELTGEASVGKSQLVLQLLLQARLPVETGGLDGNCFVLLTEGDLPSGRLNELAASICRRKAGVLPVGVTPKSLLDGIMLKRVRNIAEQETCIRFQLPQLFRRKGPGRPIRLIVIDSISHLYRGGNDVGPGSPKNRNANLVDSAAQLKALASRHGLVVVVINQVTDLFAESKQLHHHLWSRRSSGRHVQPCLGLTWSDCVTTRLLLTRDFGQRSAEIVDMDQYSSGSHESLLNGNQNKRRCLYPHRTLQITPRTLHVIFSSYWPTKSFPIALTSDGVVGVCR